MIVGFGIGCDPAIGRRVVISGLAVRFRKCINEYVLYCNQGHQ